MFYPTHKKPCLRNITIDNEIFSGLSSYDEIDQRFQIYSKQQQKLLKKQFLIIDPTKVSFNTKIDAPTSAAAANQ